MLIVLYLYAARNAGESLAGYTQNIEHILKSH